MSTNSQMPKEVSQLLNSPAGSLVAEAMVLAISEKIKKQRPDNWDRIILDTFSNKDEKHQSRNHPPDLAFRIRGVQHVLRPVRIEGTNKIAKAVHFTVDGNEKRTVNSFLIENHDGMLDLMATGIVSVYEEQQRLQSSAASGSHGKPNPKSPWYSVDG